MSIFFNIIRKTLINQTLFFHHFKKKYLRNYFVLTLGKNVNQRNKISSINLFNRCTHQSESDTDEDNINVFDYKDLKLTTTLFPQITNDELMNKLKQSSNLNDVFDFFEEHELYLRDFHLSEIFLYLWNFQSLFYKLKTLDNNTDPEHAYNLKEKCSKDLICHPTFNKILNYINDHFINYSPESLCCIILYLKKIGINSSHPLQSKLINRCLELFFENENNFSMNEISRLSTAIVSSQNVGSLITIKDFLPFIINKTDSCKNLEEFNLITICFKRIYHIISKEIFEKYCQKAEDLILEKKILTNTEKNSVIKIISFLTGFEKSNINTYRKLAFSLKGNIETLSAFQLSLLCQAFNFYQEPGFLLNDIRISAHKQMEYYQNEGIYNKTSIRLLNYLISTSSTSQTINYEDLVTDHIRNGNMTHSNHYFDLDKSLRFIFTSNGKIHETYWKEIFELSKIYLENNNEDEIVNICKRYIYFNKSQFYKYRHYEMERYIFLWISKELHNTQSWYSPRKMAMFGAFTLAFGSYHETTIDLENTISRFMSMTQQYNAFDCFNLTNSLRLNSYINKYTRMSSNTISRNFTINYLIKKQIETQLSSKIDSLSKLTLLTQAIYNLDSAPDSLCIQSISQRFKELFSSNSIKLQINSKNIQRTLFILNKFNIIVPEMMDHFCNYVLENSDDLLGEVVGNLLFTCFYFDYNLSEREEFLVKAAQIIERHKHRMKSLLLLKSCLALSYYNYLKTPLIHHIFTVEFLEQIEKEIRNFFSKNIYPMEMKKILMELNRAVCIDQPEEDIPWFHTKYCKTQESLVAKPNNYFYSDVLNNLKELVGSEEFIKQYTFSPYSHKIDFLLYLDRSGTPVHFHQKEFKHITKVAIILYNERSFANLSFAGLQLKGKYVLQRKHLEMLGYSVVDVPAQTWNDMSMSEQEAKQTYLKNKIWKHAY